MISKGTGNHVKFMCFALLKKQTHHFHFFSSRYNKAITSRFGFCDVQRNQALSNGYQPQPSAMADNPYIDLDFSGHSKTSSNSCLLKYMT